MTKSQAPAPKRTRVRMKPEVRSRLILDAALAEFSRHGFAATRIEDIAAGAGLTKTGVYAHYESKDAIFEALLTAALMESEVDNAAIWCADGAQTLPSMVDAYLDEVYRKVQHPMVLEILRLLLAESERVPELVARWHDQIVQPYRAGEQAMIDACVRRGLIRKSPVSDLFALAMSPALMWMVSRALSKEHGGISLDQVRRFHRHMLLELLRPE